MDEIKKRFDMPYSHKNNLEELINVAGIPPNDAFDYSDHDPYKVVENYFQFCQTNLTEKSDKYNIQPARIYIRARMEVNAAAKKCNEYYVMRVNFGTILIMFRLYTDHRDIFEKESLKDFAELHEKLDASLDYLLFQVSTQFTFYHEKAHLIQVSPLHDVWLEEDYAGDRPEEEPFSLKRHLYEFDADLHASTFVGFHLLEYWKKQKEELRTDHNLNLIVSIGIAAILSYFIFLQRKYLKIYYEASTHPHPLIRISYIVDNLVKAIENNIDKKILKTDKIMQNAFRIADELFLSGGSEWVKDFTTLFIEERDRIKDFIQNVLWANVDSLPELTIHRPL